MLCRGAGVVGGTQALLINKPRFESSKVYLPVDFGNGLLVGGWFLQFFNESELLHCKMSIKSHLQYNT